MTCLPMRCSGAQVLFRGFCFWFHLFFVEAQVGASFLRSVCCCLSRLLAPVVSRLIRVICSLNWYWLLVTPTFLAGRQAQFSAFLQLLPHKCLYIIFANLFWNCPMITRQLKDDLVFFSILKCLGCALKCWRNSLVFWDGKEEKAMFVNKPTILHIVFALAEIPGIVMAIDTYTTHADEIAAMSGTWLWCVVIIPGLLLISSLVFGKGKGRWLIPAVCLLFPFFEFGIFFLIDTTNYLFSRLFEIQPLDIFFSPAVLLVFSILAIITTQVLVHYFCKSLPEKAPQK